MSIILMQRSYHLALVNDSRLLWITYSLSHLSQILLSTLDEKAEPTHLTIKHVKKHATISTWILVALS